MIKESVNYLAFDNCLVDDFLDILRLDLNIKYAGGIYGYKGAHLAEALAAAFGKKIIRLFSL